MGARPYDPSLGRFLAVDPVEGGSLNNYDYAAQDPVNKFDLNGMCFRDSTSAAALDMDVAGSDRALCEAVAKMFLGCEAGFEAMNPTGLSDAEIRGICWDAVDKKLGKKHKNLWRQEALRNGEPFDPVEAFCGELGTDKYNLHEEPPKPKTIAQTVLCGLYELPTGVRWTGNSGP